MSEPDLNTAPRVLSDFAGDWRVTRRIADARGPDAVFEGAASWRPDGDSMLYHESGTMTLAGHPPLHATRRYVWTEDLAVHFEDGRLFHRVPPEGGMARHWCDPDVYELTYAFEAWPCFAVHWRVTGPRKDYRAETEYRRPSG